MDGNGKAEVWLMYKTVCHGDISPFEMKILVYEDGKKYAVRGRNRSKITATDYVGGEYTFDDAFLKGDAHEQWRQYAMRLWQQNIDEKWDEHQ